MRTSIILRDDLVKKAQKATGIEQKTALIHKGLELLIQMAAIERLIKMGGTVPDAKIAPRIRSKK